MAEQRLTIGPVAREQGDADAGGDMERLAIERAGGGKLEQRLSASKGIGGWSTPAWTTANSSPPRRASVSLAR